jgi:hypothetical protein
MRLLNISRRGLNIRQIYFQTTTISHPSTISNSMVPIRSTKRLSDKIYTSQTPHPIIIKGKRIRICLNISHRKVVILLNQTKAEIIARISIILVHHSKAHQGTLESRQPVWSKMNLGSLARLIMTQPSASMPLLLILTVPNRK